MRGAQAAGSCPASASYELLESRAPTVAARIKAALEQPIGMPHNRSGMPHCLVERRQHFDIVPARAQLGDDAGIEPRLEFQGGALPSPGAAQQPARCGDSLLRVPAVHQVTSKYRRL